MTYKWQLRPEIAWTLNAANGESFSLDEVLRLLAAIQRLGHIAGACQECDVSYRHAWGVLRKAENMFGQELLHTQRRKGSRLSQFAQQLLVANHRAETHLAPVLENVAEQVCTELDSFARHTTKRLRLHASHGFAVEELMQMAAQLPESPVELRYRTAVEALAALGQNECDIAGFQVPAGHYEKPALQHYRPWLNADQHALIYLATRETGMFVQRGNPKNIRSVADLTRSGIRFVNRQAGSGTRLLLSLMLDEHAIDPKQIDGYDSSEFTHMAIAAHVASGMADVGLGVQTAAWRTGLDFLPLAQERYFFVVRRDKLELPAMQKLFKLLASEVYQTYLLQLVGYNAEGAGQVLSLPEAFALSKFSSLTTSDSLSLEG